MSETVTNNPESSTSSPGVILKRCREYHGISLAEAAEATKVGSNYLKALEDDQTNEFASLAYLKGFLRIYASYLGLNPDDMMRLYEKMYSPVGSRGTDQTAGEGNRGKVRRRFSWQQLALPLLLLLLLIITSVIINHSTSPSRQKTTPKPATVAQVTPAVMPIRSTARQAPAEQLSDKVVIPEDTVKKEISPPEPIRTQKQTPEPLKSFVVRLKVTQNGTLAVTIDGAAPQNYDLAVGDIIEWKAEKEITLDVSNAGGVEAEVNDKPLRPFGPVGNPAFIVLNADGIKK